jgi:hypothetical protein
MRNEKRESEVSRGGNRDECRRKRQDETKRNAALAFPSMHKVGVEFWAVHGGKETKWQPGACRPNTYGVIFWGRKNSRRGHVEDKE